MTVGGIYDAYAKEVKVWGLKEIEDTVDVANIGLKGSPTKVKRSFTKQAKSAGEVFDVDADEAVRIIMDKLIAKHII